MINLIGTILGTSGYDAHTRELLNALMKFTKVKLLTSIPPGAEMHINDRELNAWKNKEDYDINLIIAHPIHWRLHTNNKRNWVYLVWEGDRVPLSFIEEMESPEIEYVIVPSMHTYDAVMNTLDITRSDENETLIKKLQIIHHGVNLEKFYSMAKNTDKFRFLGNKGFRNLEDRGGIQYLLQAYMEEFKAEENVELVLKINPAYGVPDLNKLMQHMIQYNPKPAPIRFITDNVKYEELVKIYNQANCFVSPTRAEAFNIPCIEALACGLPVITTIFGGQIDFVNNLNGWLVGGELTEVKHELMYEGIKWLTPSITELRKVMREAFELPRDLFDRKIQEGFATAKEFTWDSTAEKLLVLI